MANSLLIGTNTLAIILFIPGFPKASSYELAVTLLTQPEDKRIEGEIIKSELAEKQPMAEETTKYDILSE